VDEQTCPLCNGVGGVPSAHFRCKLCKGKKTIPFPAALADRVVAVTAEDVRLRAALEAAEAESARLRAALEGLLDGLDANGDPERCGLSQEQWENRIASARVALAGKPQ
jgi:hypothetical protein